MNKTVRSKRAKWAFRVWMAPSLTSFRVWVPSIWLLCQPLRNHTCLCDWSCILGISMYQLLGVGWAGKGCSLFKVLTEKWYSVLLFIFHLPNLYHLTFLSHLMTKEAGNILGHVPIFLRKNKWTNDDWQPYLRYYFSSLILFDKIMNAVWDMHLHT